MKIKPISAKDFRKLLKVSALNLSQEQDLAPSVIHFMERTDLYRSSLKAVAAYGNGLHLPPVLWLYLVYAVIAPELFKEPDKTILTVDEQTDYSCGLFMLEQLAAKVLWRITHAS